jgi:hypothetical protein
MINIRHEKDNCRSYKHQKKTKETVSNLLTINLPQKHNLPQLTQEEIGSLLKE